MKSSPDVPVPREVVGLSADLTWQGVDKQYRGEQLPIFDDKDAIRLGEFVLGGAVMRCGAAVDPGRNPTTKDVVEMMGKRLNENGTYRGPYVLPGAEPGTFSVLPGMGFWVPLEQR